jgi:hypothetical protein
MTQALPMLETSHESLAKLETLEGQIQSSRNKIAKCLKQIRDEKLYRSAGFRSFSAYLEARFPWSRQLAYQLLKAEATIENIVNTNCQNNANAPAPDSNRPSFSQALVLGRLPTWEQQVVSRTVDYATISVRKLKAIVLERLKREPTEDEEIETLSSAGGCAVNVKHKGALATLLKGRFDDEIERSILKLLRKCEGNQFPHC